jgi:hypothetical protein
MQMEFVKNFDDLQKKGAFKKADAYQIEHTFARFIRVVFKVLRCGYVSFYYYLMPFSIIFVSLYMLHIAVE